MKTTKKWANNAFRALITKKFQEDVADGREHNWRCRAGARYLYICEDGLVHYCSQQRGYPGIPLAVPPPRTCGARRARRAVRRSAPCRACTAWRCSIAFARNPSRRSTESCPPAAAELPACACSAGRS